MEKLLKDFTKRYIENREKCMEMDSSLIEERSFDTWKDVLIGRSRVMRDIYRENESFLKRLQFELKEPVNEETAEAIFESLSELYEGAYDDLFIMKSLADPIIPFYEEKKDYDKLVYLYKMLGFENFEFFGRILKEDGIEESVKYYEKAIALKEHYSEIKDSKNRMCIFTAYNNMISPVGQTRMDMKKKMFDHYHEVMDLWNSETVQKLDGNDEEFLERIEQIKTDVMFCESFIEEMPAEFQEEFKKLHGEVKAEAEKNGSEDEEGEIFRSDLKLRMIGGEPKEKILEEAIDYINSIPDPDYEKDEYEALLRLLNFHNSACLTFDVLKYYKASEEEEKKYTERFLKKVTEIHTSIPFNFWTSMMDELCSEWFLESAPFIKDAEEEKNLLLKLIIRRQPLTYIHSIMVSEISKEIAAAIIKGDPDFFVGILDTRNEEEVKEKGEEIIRYISDCAILHDSGKCGIVEVINRQNRHLYDDEFSIIKGHPQKGMDMLKHDEAFAPYLDVIMGHHKNYDGKGGYPINFDNTASPVRAVIDLIAIADSIDAATDILGRNYTEGKDYDTLYSELMAGSGTRYNPDIVELIGQDKRLYDELMWITGEGRHEVYYTVFDEIIF